MSGVTILDDSVENKALLDPDFRGGLSIISEIKEKHDVDYFDYDSFEDYMNAFLSSLDTKVLERGRRRLAANGETDDVADIELVDAVLQSRRVTSG